MKRVILILAILLAAGCQKFEQTDNINVDYFTPITISVSNDDADNTLAATRGSLVYSEADMGSLALYCAHYSADGSWSNTLTLTDFSKMNNTQYAYSGGSWSAVDGDVVWGYTSLTDKYTFYAYSPFAGEGATSGITPTISNGALSIKYTVPTDCASQPDLMIAAPRKDMYATSTGVPLSFRHALASVSFSVQGTGTATISSVSISGIVDEGILTWDDTENAPSWNIDGGATSMDTFTAIIETEVTPDEDYATQITTDTGYLMMIPQTIPDAGVTVTVTMSDTTTKELTIIPSHTAAWEAGEQYNYTIGVEEGEDYVEVVACFYEENTGTESDPFLISNTFDLETLSNVVNNNSEITIKGTTEAKAYNGFGGYYFKMTNDIDLSV